jgi:lipopolysaccharide/colanic/teichoic acid biosynthesis glycosyltransferase
MRFWPKTSQVTTGGSTPRFRSTIQGGRKGKMMMNGSAEAGKSVTGSRKGFHSTTRNNEGEDELSRFLQNAVTEVARSQRPPAGLNGSAGDFRFDPAHIDGGGSLNGETAPNRAELPAALYPGLPSWKRLLDLALIVLTAPLWLPVMTLIAAWVGITSPGPIFYRQPRIGFRGRRFMIVKFRTMKVNADTTAHERYLEHLMVADCPMIKLDVQGDPRLIAGGRILRATGLDELPQIFNVLAGEMSLVGPRPCTVREFERFSPPHRERVNAYPGLTGWWQVNGKNRTTFREMIEMDIFYSRNISLSLDLRIIVRTFPAISNQVRDNWQRLPRTTPHRPSSVQT